MKRIILSLALALGLIAPANAVVQSVMMGDANLTLSITSQNVVTTRALSAPRTVFLPSAAGTLLGQSGSSTYFQNCITFYDQFGAVNNTNTVTFQVNGSDNINGASTLVISATNGKATLCPTTGSGWYATVQSQAVLPNFPLAVVNGGTGASTASGTSLDNITGFASTGLINRTGAGAYSFAALPLAVANGGTASASASGTALDNITGFSGTGLVNRTGAGAYSFLAVPLLPVNGGTGEAGTITGALKGNGISPVTQAACSDLSNGTATCSAATGQLPGTATNNNASAGNVGEFTSATVPAGSAITIPTTNSPVNCASLSLTAGDWDVTGTVYFVGGSGAATYELASISSTSGTLDNTPGAFTQIDFASAGGTIFSSTYGVGVSNWRKLLSTTSTVYLIGQAGFGTGSQTMYCYLSARRRR